MARYKHIDTSPRFLAVDLQRQLNPDTLEHALNYLLDHELDLSGFDNRFCNDRAVAAAYPPAMLLKVILFTYSRGIVSSRAIERACREQITFIALSGDSRPHFTTLAAFVSSLGTARKASAPSSPASADKKPGASPACNETPRKSGSG